MAARGGQRERPDAVQLDRLLSERVHKEMRHQKLYTQYTVNPLQPVYTVTRKPMSWHDNIDEPTDDEFLKLFHRAALQPRQKYSEPQTESQEIGWNTTPLIPVDRNDCRLHFPRRKTKFTT
ncbi:protein FAM183A [Manacus candei]|uniref:protein FAM183A n=1 Tax=Manacus candei TaxID=415023 RepID=UPI002226BC16|nr:protein FAM183A [Manacus candei]